MDKQIEAIPQHAMEALQRYSWPGNISAGQALEVPVSELAGSTAGASVEPVTLKDDERVHIHRVLREAEGVIATAAARLGLPRSTLFYKMRRLGISVPRKQTAGKPDIGPPVAPENGRNRNTARNIVNSRETAR